MLLSGFSAHAGRVFLVGVDGGAWNLIEPMWAEGKLPHLASLRDRGVTARLETVEPVASPVVWTSVASGRRPDSHGVTDFLGTRLSIRVPSVFERLAASGLRVGLYDYLMTWPPLDFPGGFVIPGWLRRDGTVTPADVWQRIEMPAYANDYDTPRTTPEYLANARKDVTLKTPRWIRLVEAFDLQVGAVTFYSVDMTSHRTWHAAFPEEFPGANIPISAEEKTAIRDAIVGVDRSIGAIAATLAETDTLIVVSDHGFEARDDGGRNVWVTHLEALLAAAGFDPERDGFSVLGTFGGVSIRVHPGDIPARDAMLDRLVAFLGSIRDLQGNAAFSTIEYVDAIERPPEARRPWTNRLRQWAVGRVLDLAFDIEVEPGPHAVIFTLPDDPVLSAIAPGGSVLVGADRLPIDQVFSRQYFTGEHDPVAIFLAAGGPIAHRSDRIDLSVLDVAPLITHLAGQPIPDDLEGRLPLEILNDEYRAAHTPRYAPATSVPRLADSSEGDSPVDDPELLQKLEALGYVE